MIGKRYSLLTHSGLAQKIRDRQLIVMRKGLVEHLVRGTHFSGNGHQHRRHQSHWRNGLLGLGKRDRPVGGVLPQCRLQIRSTLELKQRIGPFRGAWRGGQRQTKLFAALHPRSVLIATALSAHINPKIMVKLIAQGLHATTDHRIGLDHAYANALLLQSQRCVQARQPCAHHEDIAILCSVTELRWSYATGGERRAARRRGQKPAARYDATGVIRLTHSLLRSGATRSPSCTRW